MDVHDSLAVAKQIRNLVRRADREGHGLQTLKEEILYIAELHEAHAERVEMEMIIQMQRDYVEAN